MFLLLGGAIRKGAPVGKRELAARFFEKSWFGLIGRRFQTWSGVLALNWHRIGDGADSAYDRSLWSATPEAFEEQVRSLKKHFDVISLHDLQAVLQKATGRYVLITFDDGYRDNYANAFPILKAHGVSAVFFVSTGYLDRPRAPWWDEIAWMVRRSPKRLLSAGPWFSAPVIFDEPHREQAVGRLLRYYKSLPGHKTADYLNYLAEATGSGRCPADDFADAWLTWDMVREMRDHGMVIGGHTVNHPILARLSRAEQEAEVAACAERLREELGEPMRYFSYPVGTADSFNYDTRCVMLDCGVQFAFSFYGGYCRFEGWNPLNMPRASVETHFSKSLFRSIVTFPQLFS